MTLPVATLGSKILCEFHNNGLSRLDQEAKHVFSVLEEIRRLTDVRRSLKARKLWNVKRYRVNGQLFERWAAKLIVGLICTVNKDGLWELSRSGPDEPPEQVARAIFGLEKFNNPMGLYFAEAVGHNSDFPSGLRIKPLVFSDGGWAGAVFVFQGFQFLMWLCEDPIIPFESGGVVFGPGHESLMYHMRSFRFLDRDALSQVLEFDWS